jgi:hypothetical protein
MPTTLLQIGQAVVNELGLPPLTSIAGNQNTTARQVLALVNRSGDEIYQSHPWIVSQDQHIVEIGDPIITTGDVVAGSGIISNIPSTAGIVANQWAVTGNSVQQSSRVIEVIDANTVEMDMYATETVVGGEMIFAKDTYAVPDAFKWFADRTMWDRTNHWELIGPMSPQADQWERSGIVTVGPRKRWRQIGTEPTNWRLWPPPTASGSYPATLVFEYNSKYWASSAGGVRQQWLVVDTDYPVIDAQAIILSTKWRLWQQKGFEYGAMQAEANDYISRLAARDGGSPDLSLSKLRDRAWLLGPQNIQDGNFPGPGNPN